MSPAVSEAELQSATSLVKSLLNSQLKDILRRENLPVSGVKLALQTRIIGNLQALASEGSRGQYDRFKQSIYAVAGYRPPTQPQPSAGYPQPTSVPSPLPPPNRSPYPAGSMPPSQTLGNRLTFKDSPFYTVLEPLTPIAECKVREHTRDTVELKVVLNSNIALRLQNEPNLRVMVYGAADNGMAQYSRCDIAFPYQVELKTNHDEVKANLRGLKNKPGTTRPADITNYIRKKPGYPNQVVLTYALTQKKFFIVVQLVQRHPIDELVRQLRLRKTISSDQVIREMKSRAQDNDIVATSSVMSLKCPLSTLRINVPCRTTLCTHNQCFDASSFLQLQEQAPTWSCPVCNKGTSFEALQIDQYVDNILQSSASSVEQVTVEPNGDWFKPGGKDESLQHSHAPEDDGDVIEISDDRPVMKREHTPVRFGLGSSTPNQSREPSSVSSATRPSSNKRPASEVIDLTLSDEDEDPRPPPKRPHYHQLNGRIPNPSYQTPNLASHGSSNSPVRPSYFLNS